MLDAMKSTHRPAASSGDGSTVRSTNGLVTRNRSKRDAHQPIQTLDIDGDIRQFGH